MTVHPADSSRACGHEPQRPSHKPAPHARRALPLLAAVVSFSALACGSAEPQTVPSPVSDDETFGYAQVTTGNAAVFSPLSLELSLSSTDQLEADQEAARLTGTLGLLGGEALPGLRVLVDGEELVPFEGGADATQYAFRARASAATALRVQLLYAGSSLSLSVPPLDVEFLEPAGRFVRNDQILVARWSEVGVPPVFAAIRSLHRCQRAYQRMSMSESEAVFVPRRTEPTSGACEMELIGHWQQVEQSSSGTLAALTIRREAQRSRRLTLRE